MKKNKSVRFVRPEVCYNVFVKSDGTEQFTITRRCNVCVFLFCRSIGSLGGNQIDCAVAEPTVWLDTYKKFGHCRNGVVIMPGK